MTQAEEMAALRRAGLLPVTSPAKLPDKLRSEYWMRSVVASALSGAEPIRILKSQLEDFDGAGLCTLIGGGRTAPDRAAFYNGALVRYLDFNDSYLAPRAKPATPATTSGRCWPPPSMRAKRPGLPDGAGRGLPGAMPPERRRPGAPEGLRSHHAGRLRGRGGVSKALGLDRVTNRPCHRHLRHGLQCAAGHAHRRAFPLEGPGLSQHRLRLHPRGLPGHARHHRPAGGLRGEQGVHGGDRGPVRDRLVEGGPGTGHADDSQKITTPRFTPSPSLEGDPWNSNRSMRLTAAGGRADRDRDLRRGLQHHRRRRRRGQDRRPDQGGGRSQPAVHGGGGPPGRSGHARAVPARADPAAGTCRSCCRKVTVRPAAAYSRQFPEEMPCRIDDHASRWTSTGQGEARLRGISHPSHVLGDGRSKSSSGSASFIRRPVPLRRESSTRSRTLEPSSARFSEADPAVGRGSTASSRP